MKATLNIQLRIHSEARDKWWADLSFGYNGGLIPGELW